MPARIQHPRINEAVEYLREAMVALKVQPYYEVESTGELRYVQLTVAHIDPYPAQHHPQAQVQVGSQFISTHIGPTSESQGEWQSEAQHLHLPQALISCGTVIGLWTLLRKCRQAVICMRSKQDIGHIC